MAALTNSNYTSCGALCSTPQSFADTQYYTVPCSNEAEISWGAQNYRTDLSR